MKCSFVLLMTGFFTSLLLSGTCSAALVALLSADNNTHDSSAMVTMELRRMSPTRLAWQEIPSYSIDQGGW